ncbi:hypothetical protein SAMN05216371_8019 [Streptomyces sp. TLI_053]|uniref:hypothetical protein n=1 Tax=Streptomyces sp. TLI_053 TaxID=1855352 RepID=UPI00087C1B9E|nr:hypothetical protein [Streptomyces sp. TLI_053]SDT83205.1 hypothetical protein SAMN05216371_8019 [Streptomyces sp. TLI_053]
MSKRDDYAEFRAGIDRQSSEKEQREREEYGRQVREAEAQADPNAPATAVAVEGDVQIDPEAWKLAGGAGGGSQDG